jgi:hypothetical protein
MGRTLETVVEDHGFVAERSVKTNALAHLHRRFVINVDLKDFFPTILQKRIGGMLASLGIDARVAEIITRIYCSGGYIPQGASSSPVLSNMLCVRLDKNLMGFAGGGKGGLRQTRPAGHQKRARSVAMDGCALWMLLG